jgi:hypothetical protein
LAHSQLQAVGQGEIAILLRLELLKAAAVVGRQWAAPVVHLQALVGALVGPAVHR